jgi:hypothetical protein
MAGPQQPPDDMSEEELRAAYEQQLKQVRVEDVLIQTVVSLLNLGGRKAGLAPGTEDERDPDQLRQAIEGVRVLLPLVEDTLGAGGDELKQLRDVLAQLQMAFAQMAPAGSAPDAPGAEKPADPGPPPPSGRIWVPGQ